ncbi:hypothetical protein MMC25_000977 [Agyrium rufum]|nr:hypothetical protein [Agyrium rufum]
MSTTNPNNAAALLAAVAARRSDAAGAEGKDIPSMLSSTTKEKNRISQSYNQSNIGSARSSRVPISDYAQDEIMLDHSPPPAEDSPEEQRLSSSPSQPAKGRNRRASEGAFLSKSEGKRVSEELSWEHTPEWSLTSKLLISKHQQVQLLEAASVLVNMNSGLDGEDLAFGETPTQQHVEGSDESSASPAASGYSDLPTEDAVSSASTTPPPMNEEAYHAAMTDIRDPKRYSSNSSLFSRSYTSNAPTSVMASSVPTAASFGSTFHGGFQRRPSTAGTDINNEMSLLDDEAGLAAAVELCNFGTPRTVPAYAESDIPPVPPLPERYQPYKTNRISAPYGGLVKNHLNFDLPPSITHRISDERTTTVHDQHKASHMDDEYDEEYDHRSVSRGRSDEDDDGVFGKMEE